MNTEKRRKKQSAIFQLLPNMGRRRRDVTCVLSILSFDLKVEDNNKKKNNKLK